MKTTHGMHNDSEYRTWDAMKQRCLNPSSTNYSRYGGRGIGICDRWLDFINFYSDMGDKPSPSHSIERIDNNKGYYPSNCKWATKSEQARNRNSQSNSPLGISGIRVIGSKYAVRIKVSGKEVSLGRYANFLDACCARKSAENKLW
jgi:hypothetical protein